MVGLLPFAGGLQTLSGEIKVSEAMSEIFGVTRGLRQGCVLSPLLFSLYINLLVEKLWVVGVGVECGGWLIMALICADDVALFCRE